MVWIFWTAVVRAGVDMSVMRTEAPSRRKRMVVSRPMPLFLGGLLEEWRNGGMSESLHLRQGNLHDVQDLRNWAICKEFDCSS